MDGNLSSERLLLPGGGITPRKEGWHSATVARDSGMRGRGARKERAHDHQKGQKVSTRQYLQIRERRGLVREILSRSRRSTETCSTRTSFRDGREASADRVGRHRCFIEQEPGARARGRARAEVR